MSTSQDTNNEPSFHKWRRMIPKTYNGDLDVLQKTITELATDPGVLEVREMIDEQIQFCNTDVKRITLWRTCVLPFFQTLTEQRVSHSAILEAHTGTIYNVVFGHDASRLGILFNFLIELAVKWTSPLIKDDDGPKAQFLELCSAILAKAISYNSQALVNEKVPPIVSRILKLIDDVDKSGRSFWTLQARKHLEYIQRRLGVIKEAARDDAPKPQPLGHAKFVLRRDLPGTLSLEGPRHDNDHEDITKIRILPTMSEIMSTRSDYRPLQDPSQLHLPGIQGLIDRHFRLLREDMVGQLKDCISEEIRFLEHPESKAIINPQSRIRTNSYNIVDIVDIKCTRRCGLEFHLKIEQPFSAGRLASEARADWWNLSKRLEAGALVCLLEKDTAVFCVVAESTLRPDPTRTYTQKTDKNSTEKRNLHSNKDFAYVNLNLAEPNEVDLKTMLSVSQSNEPVRRSLVEFPGILLPSFKPTLLALQQIFMTLDLPFAELLASSADGPTEVNIPPPLYATKSGFVFDLSCLTLDGKYLQFSPQEAINPEELCNRSSLDEGQATALLNSLKRSLELIQGPPGTGKSYTGEAIIKVLLANKEKASIGPILCVCYTNHALDQLLEHLFNGGVEQIIRIGSRSKSAVLTNLNLRNVGKEMERTKSERNASWKSTASLKGAEDEMKAYLTELKASTTHKRIKEHIKASESPFYDAIFGIEEEDWTKVTRKDDLAYFLDWVNAGFVSEKPVGDVGALKRQDPMVLSQQERLAVFTSWGSVVATDLGDEFVSLHHDYQEAKRRHDTVQREVDLRVLQEADIIGVTTTGLARNLDMFRKLDSKVLICEEAGEVLESHIITALFPSVQHAILIGDHLQLRPQVSDYELSAANPRGEQYSLDVSLFERLVQPTRPTDLKLPFDMLEIQRRMHPSISRLIRDTIYETLKDDAKVNNYPEVVGMRKRLFWLDHDRPEARSDPNFPTNTSRTNDFEIEGTYGRQLHKLRKKLQNSFELVVEARDLENLQKEGLDTPLEAHKQALGKCIRLATVDNFQGEEAKVIVISLVRSNPERQCGFLKTTNRIDVLLSRAQHGMYIIGNSTTYGEVEMWSKVISMLNESGCIGTKLPLQCPRHKHTTIEPLHRAVKCPEPCLRLKSCGHKRCSTILEGHSVSLPCGHTLTSPRCWQVKHPGEVKCLTRVGKDVPGCAHHVDVPCYEDITEKSFVCSARCGQPLPCGHVCKDSCKACRARGGTHSRCTSICGRSYSTCKHSCADQCHPGENCAPCACSKLCSEPCTPCMLPCSSSCVHSQCSMPCSAPCNWTTCSNRCGQRLLCGHQCPSLCGEACPDMKFCQICASGEIKATIVDTLPAPELREYHKINLDAEPCLFLDCGHIFTVSSMDRSLGIVDICRNADDTPITMQASTGPFSDATIRSCPRCRGSLRNISRYGTIVRRTLLEESTKKYITWSHTQSVELERQLIDEEEKLVTFKKSGRLQESISRVSNELYVNGSPIDQLLAIHDWVGHDRYKPIIHLYFTIFEYVGRVTAMEKSYRQVYDLIEHTNHSDRSTDKSELIYSDRHTRGKIAAQTSLFRCYLVVISDFLHLRSLTRCHTVVKFNLKKALEECKKLAELAQEAKYIRQEAECHIFHSKLHLSKAEALILELPAAAHLRREIDAVRRMLVDNVFFRGVSIEERRSNWKAMFEETIE
ncbi:P-loop containing nucleoside triphosphate hydrolase protein [Daldinia decipiens]|uniref:P-loop containing nucleoside triphosphate hydrolase protein n=1 Tax=Daldinia decipiens TaxID=326647 RepID=UPI0020C41ADE|nr:P-loop containing nucleoside triphosphate hydrolase protein [Daldinia decipiens]KAI1659371.1 P-loop containing nucleoside triphosphate hydrolase protein [Daldinia decipiens]